MTEQPRVFISYARQDGERFATALRQRLERDEPEVTLWQDRARMQGGVGWWKQITDALDVVQFLVLVMTPAAMQSPMARKEWRYARQQGVCVYPVKGVPDSALAYDDLPHWMRKAHFFDLEREWETFVNYLKSPSRATRVPFMAPDLPEGFVERPDVLARLLEGLIGSERANPIAGVTALRGAGGLGKTTLAAAVCHHDDVITAFDDGILWVTLGQKPNVQQGLTKLYAALTGERPGFVDEEDAAVHLAETLEEKGCLVVIDDVWEAAHLRPFLRAGANCSRLITTRQFDIAAEAKRVEVDEMTLAEAVQMLTFRLPHLPLDLVPFRALADRLGRWPLLLELAGATLMHRIGRGDTPDGAVSYLNTKLDRQGVVAFDNRNATERHQAIAKTLEVSLDLLDQPDRQHVTQLAIFHEDTDVPLEMVGALWTLDDFDTEELAQRLDGFSLVKFSLQAGTIRLHDVVRDYLVSQLIDGRGLHSRLVDTLGDPRHLSSSYAWRWLPYHFVEAHREGELRALLLDFEWLQAKLRAIDATSLLSDYDFFPHDDALRLLQGAIRLSAHVLGADKTQLAAQLLGRLPPDGPLAIRELREQALRWRGAPWLRPLRPLLTAPGESLVCTLAGHGGRVTAVAVTPDGARAISASDEGLLKVWNLEQGTEERTLAGHTDWVRAVVVTADCWHAISASDDHTIRVWNIETGKQELLIDTQYEWLRAVAVTPDGRQIISASDGPTLTVWDRGGGERGVLRGHSAKVNAMAVTADGRRGVSASDDRTVRVWDLDSLREVRTLRGHTAKVVALGLTPDNRFAISAGADDLMCLWDLAPDGGSDGPWIISARAYWVRDLKMLPDARRIITASEDHKLTIWDVQTGKPERTLVGHTDWVNAVALLPDGRAVSASDDHTLKVWDLQSTASKQTIEAPRLGGTSLEGMPESTAGPALERRPDRIRALAVAPDGRHVVSTSDDQRLRVWDVESGRVQHIFSEHTHWVVALAPDGRHVVSASADASIRVWNIDDGADRCVFRKHTDRIRAVAVTPDGRHVVSAADDRTIKLWKLDDATEELTIHLRQHWVRGLAVTPDGRQVISASDGRALKVWSLADGREQLTLRGHTARVNAVAVTSDGRRAVSASDDHTLVVWNLEDGSAETTLRGHRDRVNSVAVTPDGGSTVSASSDQTVRLWNLTSGELIAIFSAESPLSACAVLPDGGAIVAGDQTGLIHVLYLEGVDKNGVFKRVGGKA